MISDDYGRAEKYYVQALGFYKENEEENEDNIIDMYNKLIDVYKEADDLEKKSLYENKLRELANHELEL